RSHHPNRMAHHAPLRRSPPNLSSPTMTRMPHPSQRHPPVPKKLSSFAAGGGSASVVAPAFAVDLAFAVAVAPGAGPGFSPDTKTARQGASTLPKGGVEPEGGNDIDCCFCF